MLFNVNAIGISPPRITVDFEPFLEEEYSFYISNNIGQDMTAQVEIYEEMLPYITPNTTTSFDVSDGATGEFKFKVKLPEYLEPGLHLTRFRVTGIGKIKGPGMFQIRTAVVGQFVVRVPYPGKYIEYSWSFSDIKENETALFTVDVTSRGNETINDIYGFIDIFDINWKNLARVPTTKITDLQSTKSGKLYANWDSSGNPPGVYNVKLTLYYDGIYKEDVKQMRIGTLNVKIINYTREFEPDTINRFEVVVESEWNELINNVYAETKIFNETQDIKTIKTPFQDISPWSKATLEGFWDTHDVSLGEYDINISVFFDKKITSQAGKIMVIKKEKAISPISLFKLDKEKAALFLTWTLSGILIIIVIILLILLFTKRGKKQKI